MSKPYLQIAVAYKYLLTNTIVCYNIMYSKKLTMGSDNGLILQPLASIIPSLGMDNEIISLSNSRLISVSSLTYNALV